MFGLIDNNLRDAAAERRGSRRDSAVEARVKIIVYSWLLPPNSNFHPLLSSWPCSACCDMHDWLSQKMPSMIVEYPDYENRISA